MDQPNILFVMTDQQRFDTIAALGNTDIHTPNMDRLVRRGLAFEKAYAPCPVCVAARYGIRTGCLPPTTRVYSNGISGAAPGQADTIEGRCGVFLAKRMKELGYRTFGVGKFHTTPWDEDIGYEVQLHSEELYSSADQRTRDAFASWIAREHPAYDFQEGLMGERTEMYYMPQMSAMPAEATVEGWAAARAVELIAAEDRRPYFGFVSFVGPHPPFAPPIPYNRLYNPDRMPDLVPGELETDHMDDQIPWMNHLIWAEDINDSHARVLKARYYGELTYIDACLGRILDAVEARPDGDNTLICFYSDHGDLLGDHHGWQKESFFEASCHVPFLLSWPARLPKNERRTELAMLTDLFGIATHAAGAPEPREGVDLLYVLNGHAMPRDHVLGFHREPGTPWFKCMAYDGRYKYIYLANGGLEQLFDLENDPHERENLADSQPDIKARLREVVVNACATPGAAAALEDGELRAFPFQRQERKRIHQFDRSRGVRGFPEKPADVLSNWRPA